MIMDSILQNYDNIQMPWSIDAEQAVLGSVLVDPSCLHDVAVHLKPEMFYQKQHSDIFSAMIYFDNIGKPIDPIVVLNYLTEHDIFDNASGKNYLFELSQNVPSTENVEQYAKIVKEKFYLRSLINFSEETIKGCVNQEMTANELLDNAEQKIYNIRKGKTNDGPSKLHDLIINDVFDRLSKLTGEDSDQYKGYTTGFSELDSIITGLNRSDLIIVGARPAMGKTSFALNVARNVAIIAKRKTLMFSLEMTKEQLASRVLATEALVSSSKMRTGLLSSDEFTSIGMAANRLHDAELYFDDTSSITVPEMKAKIRRLGGVECVIIDYLGLIHSSIKAENRVNEVSEITRSLKNMAKDLNIPIICCCQLSRGTEVRGKSHKPQLADLRESGSIEQDADIVMMLYREDYYKGEKEDDNSNPESDNGEVNKVSVLVVKNRHGSVGQVDFAWDGEHTKFISIDRVHNEA